VASDTQPELTVEQLAHATGMSVRNIRNHQSRGLLPPPEVRARTGYYGQEHVDRLRLIQQMQSEGFNLGAIQRLIGAEGPGADRFAAIRELITDPGAVEPPEVLGAEELVERFGPLQPKALTRALKLGVLVDLGDGRFEAPSPALLHAADELIARGVSLETALAVLEKVRRNSQNTARVFVDLFLEEVWKPFDRQGRPEGSWGEISESIEGLRPLASDAVLAIFRQVLAAEMEDAFGKLLRDQGRSKGKG
jgi:DNA-binding transcriptional MerR regulator